MRILLAAALLALVSAAGMADIELVVQGGRILEGQEVKLEDGFYLLKTADGTIIPLPEELVEEIRETGLLPDDPEELVVEPPSGPDEPGGLRVADPQDLAAVPPTGPGGPAGMQVAEPQVLAGEPVRYKSTSEQLEVLGDPARFRSGVIDPRWRPENGLGDDVTEFNPVDWVESIIPPEWTPEWSLDEDATEFHPAEFRAGVVDPNWQPEDGFVVEPVASKKKPPVAVVRTAQAPAPAPAPPPPPVVTASATTPPGTTTAPPRSPVVMRAQPVEPEPVVVAAPRLDPGDCAVELFRSIISWKTDEDWRESLVVASLDADRYKRMTIPVHEATLVLPSTSYRLRFTTAADECRPLGDGKVKESPTLVISTVAFNAAVGKLPPPVLPTEHERVEYALAVYSLLSPDRPDIELLRSIEELERFSKLCIGECTLNERKTRKAVKGVEAVFATPAVAGGSELDVVTFFTWTRNTGEVHRRTLYLASDGTVSAYSELVGVDIGLTRVAGKKKGRGK